MTGDDSQQVTDRAGELAELIPSLAAALSRDNVPSDGRSVLSAGGVVNADVLHAMITLKGEIPSACAAAAGLAGEPWHPRPLDTCLRAIPRLHHRLVVISLLSDARRVERAVERWLRVVKLALGLRTPDMPIGYDCPLHDEPSPLIAVGSEGFLRPGSVPPVLWQYAERIWCPLCGEAWPGERWLHLGRLIGAAG